MSVERNGCDKDSPCFQLVGHHLLNELLIRLNLIPHTLTLSSTLFPFAAIVTDENYETLGERDKRNVQRSNQEAARPGQLLRHQPLGLHSAPTLSTTTTTTAAGATKASSSSSSATPTATVASSAPLNSNLGAGLGESGWVPVRPPP